MGGKTKTGKRAIVRVALNVDSEHRPIPDTVKDCLTGNRSNAFFDDAVVLEVKEINGQKPKRLYGKKGFTNQVMEKLGEPDMGLGELSHYDFIKPETLKEIAEIIPEGNLEDSQNYAPKFEKFLEIAEENKDVRFSIYIVPKSRWDERVTVTTIFIPRRKKELINELRKYRPDEDSKVVENGKTYQRLWWD